MRFPSSPFSRKRSTSDLKTASTISSPSSSGKSSLATTPEVEVENPTKLFVKINRMISGRNMSTSTTTQPTPTPTPIPTPEIPLSLFVLLPASVHSNHVASTHAQPNRPSALVSRKSGSNVQTLRSMAQVEEPESLEKEQIPEIDKLVTAGRRMSLAPGIGTGTQTRSDGRQYAITPSMISFADVPLEESPRREAKPFGARTLLPAVGGRRRPQTAATAATPISPAIMATQHSLTRGSIAIPNGGGLLHPAGGVGKTRPGWEGDEVVGVLRGSGLEVTVIRHASQIPSILSPSTSSPRIGSFNKQTLSSRPTSPVAATPVILVPLSDSPTLPSLSLLLQQGTTPTAICFQQDLLDRAKRSEEEWLPAALQQIRQVVDMRNQSVAVAKEKASLTDRPEIPVVLAYSANPAIASTTIAACVNAGASGVLKPPYDLETARFLRRMIRAAREGRISSVVGLTNQLAPLKSLSPTTDSSSVVLPPTSLLTGGEHGGEKALSGGPSSFGRRPSDLRDGHRGLEVPKSAPRKGSVPFVALPASSSTQSVTNPSSTRTAHLPSAEQAEHLYIESLFVYRPGTQKRRRSVDTAGLGMALRRAQQALETAPVTKPRAKEYFDTRISRGETLQDEKESEEDDDHDTQLAELLSAMFYQTQQAIQIRMTEFERFSTPMSRAHQHRLVDALSTWNFKPHNLDDGDLFRAACLLFDGLLNSEGLVELELHRDQVHRLLFAIRAIYHAPNPYHNYVHAIDVLQATYSFLVAIGVAPPFSYLRELTPDTAPWRRPDESMNPSHGPGSRRARQALRPQDVFAIVVAAMGHDVGHPGLSNAFMKNAKTPLSQVYDDKSVLENMHCMLIVQLLRKHGFGFLLNPPRGDHFESIPARASFDFGGFRHLLYSSILATDMSLHFVWMQDLQHFGEKISHESGVYAKNRTAPGMANDEYAETDRVMFAQAVIKCADISNPTRPIDVSEYWSSVLLKEWAVQASLETDLDLPVSVIGSADAALQAKGQIGFIKLFTQPLYDAVSDVLPELQCYADWCEENHGMWESRAEALKTHAGTRIVQEPVEDAVHDERFATLFPLSLPVSLVTSTCLEPGPTAASTPATPIRQMKASEPYMVHAASPSAKAMRAVYHATLLDQRHGLFRWTGAVPIPGVLPSGAHLASRRASTPGLEYSSASAKAS